MNFKDDQRNDYFQEIVRNKIVIIQNLNRRQASRTVIYLKRFLSVAEEFITLMEIEN